MFLSVFSYKFVYPDLQFYVSVYTTCLVHALTSRNLPMLKGAYKTYVEVSNKKFK
jgi:hypothetical protein